MKSKAELRKEILKLRAALNEEEWQQKSNAITEQVLAQKEFQEADTVLLFASYKSEVDTGGIFQAALQANKKIFFPKVEGKEMSFYQVTKETDLVERYRGIPEPKADGQSRFFPNPEEKVFVLMPGAVFDKNGGRIGYGGGYYDRFLQWLESQVPKGNVWKVAIAFSCQIVECGVIPREMHDVAPDELIYS